MPRPCQGGAQRVRLLAHQMSDRVSFEMIEDGQVGVPAVEDWRGLAEPHRLGWGMVGELLPDATAGDNDAGMSVPAQKHTKAPGIEVELAGVPTT